MSYIFVNSESFELETWNWNGNDLPLLHEKLKCLSVGMIHVCDDFYGYVDEEAISRDMWLCGFNLNGEEYLGLMVIFKLGKNGETKPLNSQDYTKVMKYLSDNNNFELA